VNDALAHGLVEFPRGYSHRLCRLLFVSSLDSRASIANGGLQLAFHGAVALGCLGIGLNALFLRLNVRHVTSLLSAGRYVSGFET